MDFGIFTLCNRREASQTAAGIIRDSVDRIRLAESAGFKAAWFAEHHFSNYSLIPSPLLMVAHCARVTQRIRLGTGIVIASMYHPTRLLSEVAFVDSMCDGRLDLGVGSGYQPHELARFGTTVDESPDMTEEVLDILEGGLANPEFEYKGKHFSLPHTHMAIPPVQRPHPPIWFAGSNPQLHRRAARKGYPVIVTGLVKDIDGVVEGRRQLEAIWRAEGGDPKTFRYATHRFCFVTDSKADALEYADNCRFQFRLARYLRARQEELAGGMLPEEPMPGEPSLEKLIDDSPIGDPQTVAAKLCEEIRRARPFHNVLYMHSGAFPQAKAMRSIERFGAEVLPLIEKELGPLDKIGHEGLPAA